MELALFDEVADVARGLLPPALASEFHCRAYRYSVKVWLGAADPPSKLHYEAQVVARDAVPGAKVLGLEVGFHAEHRSEAENEAVIAGLLAAEKKWRKVVGPEAEVGPFLGRIQSWRRISETWPDPDLSDPDLPMELGSRLADYITAIQPLLPHR